MRIYTIGFTGKTARDFFEALQNIQARRLLDIRIHNNSQLAGFTKKGNIEYFLEKLTGLAYLEMPLLAPSAEMFKQYRADRDWPTYEGKYIQLLRDRNAGKQIDRALLEEGVVFLCSEPTPEKCHRRLAAEFLQNELSEDIQITHL